MFIVKFSNSIEKQKAKNKNPLLQSNSFGVITVDIFLNTCAEIFYE